MSEQEVSQPTDIIPLDEAETLTTNWRNYISPSSISGDYIRAFYIPIADIQQLAAFHDDAEAVRAYICLSIPDDPTTAKIVLVPVSKKGKDILSVPSGDRSGEMVSSIYDFTQPCPQACDFDSPLYES